MSATEKPPPRRKRAKDGEQAADDAERPPESDGEATAEEDAGDPSRLEELEPEHVEERPYWIAPWEIALLCSKRRSGKSTVELTLAGLFTACQILFLDVKCRYVIEGVEPTVGLDALATLDWSKQRVIHFQPAAIETLGDRRAEEREWWGVFALANERQDLCVVCDECVPTPLGVNATPGSAKRYIERKAVDRCGMLAATGRWRGTSTHLRAHANHLLVWPGGLADDELDDLAREIGCGRLELRAWLEQTRELGEFAFLWYDRDQQIVRRVPPLPEHLRAHMLAEEIAP